MTEERAYADDAVFIAPDGNKMKYSMLRATATRAVIAKQRNLLKRMTPEKKKDFYYRVYELIDKHTIDEKTEPIMRIGVSPYTFMNDPLMVGGFQTSYGDLFQRMHRAFVEASQTYDFGE